jgi:hypothetical protein
MYGGICREYSTPYIHTGCYMCMHEVLYIQHITCNIRSTWGWTTCPPSFHTRIPHVLGIWSRREGTLRGKRGPEEERGRGEWRGLRWGTNPNGNVSESNDGATAVGWWSTIPVGATIQDRFSRARPYLIQYIHLRPSCHDRRWVRRCPIDPDVRLHSSHIGRLKPDRSRLVAHFNSCQSQ